jgi:3',5'-nucleoside bisphosphate phosphatase
VTPVGKIGIKIGYNVRLMNRRYDLHSHSLASDGTLSPTELVARAAAAGVNVLALTDHDETGGIAEACKSACHEGIELVPGVEISVTWANQTVHVLGLQIDPDSSPLCEGLAKLREFRDWRAEEMGRRLAKHGINGSWEAARSMAQGRIVSRTHFARFLVQEGHAANVRDVFKRFLKPNKPGFVNGEWASLEDAVGWIHTAGGQAVIAHPARYKMSATKRRKLLDEFVTLGGDGLEVVSGSHSRGDNFSMAHLAKKFGLLASAGSDYHGPENPWVELGRLEKLPDGCTPVWSTWSTTSTQQCAPC